MLLKTKLNKNPHFLQILINILNLGKYTGNKNEENTDINKVEKEKNKENGNKNETEISFIIDEEEKSDTEVCKIILLKKNGEKISEI